MSTEESSPATAHAEAVEELLRQLVDARFVLTDRDGAVTRWSRPAEELFGWPNARMLGRPLIETLALAGELPEFGGLVQTVARRKDGTELELRLTFIPVGMSQSLEFNGFLEALEIAAPRGNALKQLQRSHKTVVDWVSAAMGGHARLEDDDLAAGTIVAFRPLVELPPATLPPEEDPDRAATAAAAGQIADAVEAALGRSEELERALEDKDAELVQARGEAEAVRSEVVKAGERISHLGSELTETRRALDELREQAEEERDRTRATVQEAREVAERLERELAGTPQAQERLSSQLEETRATVAELRATREKVDALESELAKQRVAEDERRRVESELRDTRTRVDQLEAGLVDARERVGDETALTSALTELRERVEALAGDIAKVSETAAGDDLEELRSRLAALEGATPEAPPELHELLERTGARLEELERAQGDDSGSAGLDEALDELRTRVDGLASGLASQASERDERLRATSAGEERVAAEARAQAEQQDRLREDLEALRGKLESITGERIEEHRVLAGDLADTHAKLNGLVRAVTDERQRADEARTLLAELRHELAQLRSSGVAAADGGSLPPDAVAAVERLTALAEQAADAARTHSAGAEEASTRAEARASRAEEAAGAAEAQALRAADGVAGVDERIARAQHELATIEGELTGARAAAEAVTARAAQAEEAVEAAGAQAARVQELASAAEAQAAAAEGHAARAEVAAGAMEANAVRAEEAAASVSGEAERVVQAAADQQANAERAEQAAGRAESAIARGDELAARIETDIERAGSAAAAVERTIERADETAAGVQRDAQRAETAAEQVRAAVQRSAEIAGEVEARIARVDERASAVERQAERTEAAVAAADRSAERAGEQAGSVEETARRLADAAAAAEREATRAREAAEEAAHAAGVARQAADEAGASAHRQSEELRVISRFEAHGPPATDMAHGNGAPVAPAPAMAPAAPAMAPAAAPSAARRPLLPTKDTGPTREPRPGFDDLAQPTARIGLDGRFQELNQAFSDLVGYSESEFQQAVWPPVMDRANLDKHRQQMKDMLGGQMESADVKTGYVHAQGLLVPVVGKITLVRENGEPSHFLLQTS